MKWKPERGQQQQQIASGIEGKSIEGGGGKGSCLGGPSRIRMKNNCSQRRLVSIKFAAHSLAQSAPSRTWPAATGKSRLLSPLSSLSSSPQPPFAACVRLLLPSACSCCCCCCSPLSVAANYCCAAHNGASFLGLQRPPVCLGPGLGFGIEI